MPADPFDVLGLMPTFAMSRRDIERGYLRLAASLHPDIAAGDEEAAKRMAEVNQARAILDNPESRADALLHRLGGPCAGSERSLPPGFLAEMLETREEIETAMVERDPQRRADLARRWAEWSRRERDRAIAEVGAMFAALPTAEPARAGTLRDIRIRLNAWRYVERLIEQLQPPPMV